MAVLLLKNTEVATLKVHENGMSCELALNFHQRKLQANESLIMDCLQINRELLLLATFLRVHSSYRF